MCTQNMSGGVTDATDSRFRGNDNLCVHTKGLMADDVSTSVLNPCPFPLRQKSDLPLPQIQPKAEA